MASQLQGLGVSIKNTIFRSINGTAVPDTEAELAINTDRVVMLIHALCTMN